MARGLEPVGAVLTVGTAAYSLSIKQWVAFRTINFVRNGRNRGYLNGRIGPVWTVGSAAYLLDFNQQQAFRTLQRGRTCVFIEIGLSLTVGSARLFARF